jgi:multidrug efflux pump subunit AcrA (membrane-fusion protein)
MLLCGILLAGCSDGGEKSTAQDHRNGPTAPNVVAMARGKIEVKGGLLSLKTGEAGRVAHLAVEEGERVEAGQVLLMLDEQAAKQRVSVAQAEVQRADAQRKAAADRLPAARELTQRLQKAAKAGAADAQRAEDARQQLKQLEAALSIARADLDIAQARVAQERLLLAERSLRAPQSGLVTRLNVTQGAWVSPDDGGVLAVLLPERPLQVRAELNERFIDRVSTGMKADIVLETDGPAAPLQAHVMRLGEVFSASHLDDDSGLQTNTRVVDCLLSFDKPPALRVGQNVRVNFHD